ncbi:uncharacterized protein AKAW2_50507S [Aspergillus luchuensis]|uniref:Thioesterase domain-containing protein n=1 Tax=Aspergillus kawachii TaxID=1069201 RepID=A0A7R7WC05_ASPKA|nr:uncharacterized protein AKAW2_50507S [Aspergillus luchuensis]BCS00166.1 hypothetical protein AKAW2_50507S [Aspergillus luchuensis]
MSDSGQRRPTTPITLPVTSDTNPPAEAASPESFSPFCPCCTTSPSEETNPSSDVSYPSAILEERLLRTLTFYSSSPSRIQAIAVLPYDHRVTKNWLLIELLCHRVFAALPDQGTIRRVSSSYHARASPGDVLLTTAYPATQASFRWLEATVTKGNELMATVTALYDGPVLGGTADMSRD